MEKLLLVGAGGFGRGVLKHASSHFYCAFLDDRETKDVDGVSMKGSTADMTSFFPVYKQLFVPIVNNVLGESFI